jgi:hypothetical protein
MEIPAARSRATEESGLARTFADAETEKEEVGRSTVRRACSTSPSLFTFP